MDNRLLLHRLSAVDGMRMLVCGAYTCLFVRRVITLLRGRREDYIAGLSVVLRIVHVG